MTTLFEKEAPRALREDLSIITRDAAIQQGARHGCGVIPA
jgi:hypothetical protein